MAVSKVALVGAVMAFMLIVGSHAQSTFTCDQVVTWLTPCIAYAVLGGSVSPSCCQGIYSINAAYKNGDDRRGSCQCIKDKAANIPGINYDRVNAIPGLCGTKCPYKVYPTTNCSMVKSAAKSASNTSFGIRTIIVITPCGRSNLYVHIQYGSVGLNYIGTDKVHGSYLTRIQ